MIIIFFVCMAKLPPLVHITLVCILLINNLSYFKRLVTSPEVFHKKPLQQPMGKRYLHFVYSYRTNRNKSDSITVFNIKNRNINNNGNSHLPISCLCIQGEALTIKRQWKREMKLIKQKVNVWLLVDALAFIIMSDEFIMEAFCKYALMNSGKQLPLMSLHFFLHRRPGRFIKVYEQEELNIYYLCLVKKTGCKRSNLSLWLWKK